MSGHSKWAQIKHRKAATDARRGQLFTKLARAITVAAREGGGDPEGNFALAAAVQKARDYSMPKDNIQRAIDRGDKHGGSLGEPGSVAWVFEKRGVVLVDANRYSEDDLIAAIDAGADDVSADGDSLKVLCAAEHLTAVREALESAGVQIETAELTMEPKSVVQVEDGDASALMRLMDALDDHDDVEAVHANFDIPAEHLERAAA